MFRDSRGVVHTVSSPDPLADVPAGAARALQDALLAPPSPGAPVDVGGVLALADSVRELLARWQDAFFDALPEVVDLAEEARWAAEAGLSLADVEADAGQDDRTGAQEELDDELELVALGDLDDPDGDEAGADALDADDFELLLDRDDDDDPRAGLPEALVTALERELLLLPVRVRLEALVAADDLVQEWAELVGDREKLLGHLVLSHGELPEELGHESLAGRHATLHAEAGPGHVPAGRR
ncbi:MAG TPA: hypothetical protein VNU26_02435 [Mycobacteriales bacterium]|nr:hypothetical protein [Mycobacteriales bacterium]